MYDSSGRSLQHDPTFTYLRMFPPRSMTRSGLSFLRKNVRCHTAFRSGARAIETTEHTCASRMTPRRSSTHKSLSTRLPSSSGSRQLVKQIRPLEEVMAVMVVVVGGKSSKNWQNTHSFYVLQSLRGAYGSLRTIVDRVQKAYGLDRLYRAVQ